MAKLPVFKEVTPVGVSRFRDQKSEREVTSIILAVTEASYDDKSGEYKLNQRVYDQPSTLDRQGPIPKDVSMEPSEISGVSTIEEVQVKAREHHDKWVDWALDSMQEDYQMYYYL